MRAALGCPMRCAESELSDIELMDIARLLFLGESALNKLSFKPDLASPKQSIINYSHHVVPQLATWPPFRQLCSLCVKENGYHEQLWALVAVAACPKHQTRLLSRCPECGRKMASRRNWTLTGLLTCRCGAQLSSGPIHPAPDGALRLAGVIFERFGLFGKPSSFASAHARLGNMALRDILELANLFTLSQTREPAPEDMPELMDAFYRLLTTVHDLDDIPGYAAMPAQTFEATGISPALARRLILSAKRFDWKVGRNAVISAPSLMTSSQNLPISVHDLMEMHIAAGHPTLCNVPNPRPADLFFLITHLFETVAAFCRENTPFTMTCQAWGRQNGMSDAAARKWVIWDDLPRLHVRIGGQRMVMVGAKGSP